jgi:5-methyltetrahydrofolate--homocysteine methyltransferase
MEVINTMAIEFSMDRWTKIKENYRLWWAGRLERPIVQVWLTGADTKRPESVLPSYGFHSFYDSSVSAQAIVDCWDYNLCTQRFLGDAFPSVFPNFGPGVIAAFLGARLENGQDTVWFHPSENRELADLSLAYDAQNCWFNRIKDIYRAAINRWQGLVQVGMTDLGGNLDILASFRPGETLLTDLYDKPEDVKQVLWQSHDLWHRYYNEMQSILKPMNPGYSGWESFFSEEPFYMLQCDFCYMISPAMFDEFVRPELAATCKRLSNPFYHLDGKGQLPHLDSLLSIPELKGIQWVPGAGQPPANHYIDIYKKILGAGKNVQLVSPDNMTFEILDDVLNELGTGRGVITGIYLPADQEDVAHRWLEKLGVE